MASDSGGGARPQRTLPPNPNPEHLKKEAKDRLRNVRQHSPDARLAQTQLETAREYGFTSWRSMMAEIGRRRAMGQHERLIGWYQIDPALIANTAIAITFDKGQLFAQDIGQPKVVVVPDGDGFKVPGLDLRYRFEIPAEGPATALLIERDGESIRAARCAEQAATEAQAAFARETADQARPRTRIDLPIRALEPYVGWYKFPIGLVIEVRLENGKLLAQASGQQPLEIQPEAADRFFYPLIPAQLTFQRSGAEARWLKLHQNGRITTALRISPQAAETVAARYERERAEQERPRTAVTLSSSVLARYPGRYVLTATASFDVTLIEGHLFGQVTGQRRVELFAESETEFFMTVVAAQVTFVLGTDERVTHAVLHQHGRDILMVRTNEEEALA